MSSSRSPQSSSPAPGHGALTLAELCVAKLTSHVKTLKALKNVGDLPYNLVRPILLKIHDSKQLRAIERNCPQIAEASNELWYEMIKREIPLWESWPIPENSNRWYEIYCYMIKESKSDIDADILQLTQTLNTIKSARESNTMQRIYTQPPGRPSRPRYVRPAARDQQSKLAQNGRNIIGKPFKFPKANEKKRTPGGYGFMSSFKPATKLPVPAVPKGPIAPINKSPINKNLVSKSPAPVKRATKEERAAALLAISEGREITKSKAIPKTAEPANMALKRKRPADPTLAPPNSNPSQGNEPRKMCRVDGMTRRH